MDLYVYYIFVILCKDLYGINAVQWFLFVLSRAVHVLGAYLLYFHIVFVLYVFVYALLLYWHHLLLQYRLETFSHGHQRLAGFSWRNTDVTHYVFDAQKTK